MSSIPEPEADSAADDLRRRLSSRYPNYSTVVERTRFSVSLRVRVETARGKALKIDCPDLLALVGLLDDERVANAFREIDRWIAEGTLTG